MAAVTVDDVRDVLQVDDADIPDEKVLKMIKRAQVTLTLELSTEINYQNCSEAQKEAITVLAAIYAVCYLTGGSAVGLNFSVGDLSNSSLSLPSLDVLQTQFDRFLSNLKESYVGEEIQISYYPNEPAAECSLFREMRVEEGTRKDWEKLSTFHYRGHKTSVPRKIFTLKRKEELCGVIVYCYPPPSCYGRRRVLPRMSMKELNQKLSIINRVVIHPKYRTMGLGARLIRETLPLAGTPSVELIAVMPKYNPFAEKAGMQKIAQQETVESVSIVANTLIDLGFDFQLLGSQRYILQKLESLSAKQIEKVKVAFIKNKHPRFKREFGSGGNKPYGETNVYLERIKEADLIVLTKLIRLLGFLLQKKVYLFWNKSTC